MTFGFNRVTKVVGPMRNVTMVTSDDAGNLTPWSDFLRPKFELHADISHGATRCV
jgi:hypothetical protein